MNESREPYYVIPSGKVVKIKEMNDKQLSKSISSVYGKMRILRSQLNCMHDVLFERRKRENPSSIRTNTDLKVIEHLGLKTKSLSKLANDKTFVSKANSYLIQIEKSNAKIKEALKYLEEGNIDKTMKLLKEMAGV